MIRDNISTSVSILLIVLTVSVCVSCHTEEHTPSDDSNLPAAEFPYPPFEITTDVAIPLSPPLSDAAMFALEMSVENRLKNNPHDDTIERRYRSRIAPQADFTDSPPAPDIVVGDTGGALHRAVGVRELPDHGFEVSICEFDTPGLYTKFKSGNLVGPDLARPYTLVVPVVRWTDEPAADGTTPTDKRWLLMDSGVVLNQPDTDLAATCEPFKPEPFVQKMPDPTTPPSPRIK